MEQRDRAAMEKQKGNFLERLEVSTRYPADVISLIRSDLEFGLTEAQVQEYYRKPWEIQKMRIYSKCLRSGFSKEAIDVITMDKLTWQQMEVAFEFYDRCVPLETIKAVVTDNESAFGMRKALSGYLRNLKNAKEDIEAAPDYVKELFSNMEKSISKLVTTQEQYAALSQKLSELQTEKQDKEVEKCLLEENKSLNKLISEQQNKINQGEKKIAELRDLVEKSKEEVKALQTQITELETDNRYKDKLIADFEKQEKSEGETEKIPSVPVYYQIPVMDRGRVADRISVDRTETKTNRIATIIGNLCFKKKSRQDIVRLVSNGNLDAEQLEQIKAGMERGLTEQQLEQLINNNLSPERMAKVIAIAEIENKMNN